MEYIDFLITAKYSKVNENPEEYNIQASVPDRGIAGGLATQQKVDIEAILNAQKLYQKILKQQKETMQEPSFNRTAQEELLQLAQDIQNLPLAMDLKVLSEFQRKTSGFVATWALKSERRENPLENLLLHRIEELSLSLHKVLSGDVLIFLDRELQRARSLQKGLRIIFRMPQILINLQFLPWELLVLPVNDGHVAIHLLGLQPDVAILRHVPEYSRQELPLLDNADKPSIIVSQAPTKTPINQSDLHTQIESAIPGRANWFTEPTTEDMVRKALASNPPILHVVCHGSASPKTKDQKLYLQWSFQKNSEGLIQIEEINLFKLALLLRDTKSIKLVILSVCYSGLLYQDEQSSRKEQIDSLAHNLVRLGIPRVVAIQDAIDQQVANRFVARIYQALAAGELVESAMTKARIQSFEEGSTVQLDWTFPVLYTATNPAGVTPWSERFLEWGERVFLSKGWLAHWRSTLLVVLLVILAGSLWRLLRGQANDLPFKVFQFYTLYWAIWGAILSVIMYIMPPPDRLLVKRTAGNIRLARLSGRLIGYMLGGVLYLIVAAGLVLLPQPLPAWAWYTCFFAGIGWSSVFAEIAAFSQEKSEQRFPELFEPKQYRMFALACMVAVFSIPIMVFALPAVLQLSENTWDYLLGSGWLTGVYASLGLLMLRQTYDPTLKPVSDSQDETEW